MTIRPFTTARRTWIKLLGGLPFVGAATAHAAPMTKTIERAKIRRRPAALTQEARVQQIRSLSKLGDVVKVIVETGAKLSVRSGYIADKAKMWLVGSIAQVDWEHDFAIIPSLKASNILNPFNIEFKPDKVGKLFVDVTVHSAFDETPKYFILTSGAYGSNTENLEQSVPDSNGHITFLMNATSTDWHSIQIYANKDWIFYGAEISRYT
jgi:hypothetical protein